MKKQTRFVMVAGGVISGVGKGVATASIGKILQEHGHNVTIIKIDPYLNYDAGTLRPTEHGEVWVTDDGGEIDQDLGTYERFLNIDIPKKNNITSGQVYKAVIDRERQGGYLGQTVQFVPHIINEVIDRIKNAAHGYDIAIIEVGGTVGDYENVPFLFALKALEREYGFNAIAYVLVTYFPVPSHIHEMKTKPTQQAIRLLSEQGILPDFIICRSETPIDEVRKKKIEECAHIPSESLIAAPNVESVYEIPLLFEEQQFGQKLLNRLSLTSHKKAEWHEWKKRVAIIGAQHHKISIGIVGKYLSSGNFSLTDSYVSVYHALIHAGAEAGVSVNIEWIDAVDFEKNNQTLSQLDHLNGILVPGGFGSIGVEGKIAAIHHVRTHNIPYLGLCYGLQLAVIEYARNVCGLPTAHTTEVDETTSYPLVTLLPYQHTLLSEKQYGATMRLGKYDCMVQPTSRVANAYIAAQRATWIGDSLQISERHRHRYEVNPAYIDMLEQYGLSIVGSSIRDDGLKLVEFIELPQHPFFVATQAHPEFTSRFGNANPLFRAFLEAAITLKGHNKFTQKR